MAHHITERDGVFTVREPAWHGLGEVLPDYPSREQAQKIAHPWEPVSEPVYRKVPYIDGYGVLREKYEPIDEYQAMVRSDDGYTLGVVSDTYELVGNSEMYDIAEAVESGDPDSVMYETGGSLKGGRKVWLLLRLKEPLKIDGDPKGDTIPYFALQNAHDGSGAFRGQSIMTRIVCDNTSGMADLEARQRGTEFVFHHTKNVKARIEQARKALEGWRESVQAYNRLMNHLAGVEVTDPMRELFIEQFIPTPPPHMYSARVATNIENARSTLRTIYSSVTCRDTANTAYGVVQGAIEYNQHYRKARNAESRFKRAYLERSAVTADAVQLVTDLVGVGA